MCRRGAECERSKTGRKNDKERRSFTSVDKGLPKQPGAMFCILECV